MQTVFEWAMLNLRMSQMDLPTKKEFGKIMHDKDISEKEKQKVLRKVEMANGYENLQG